MNVSVQRLDDGARAALVAHFRALSAEDRRLRFGSWLSPEAAAAYADSIDLRRDAVFAVRDDHLLLVGVAHVAFGGGLAELGLSVLPTHRGQGIGSALFERGATHARNRFMPRLYMHCLTENSPIMRIAGKFGMNIVTNSGDADAHLELPRATPASITAEFVTDRLAQYDYALKSQGAAWSRLIAALSDAAPESSPPRTYPA